MPLPRLRRTLTLFEPTLEVMASRSPSPSRSPRVTEPGKFPTAKVGGLVGAKVPPPRLRRTLTLLLLALATQASRSPSPSRSPRVTERGPFPTAKVGGVEGRKVPPPWLR